MLFFFGGGPPSHFLLFESSVTAAQNLYYKLQNHIASNSKLDKCTFKLGVCTKMIKNACVRVLASCP